MAAIKPVNWPGKINEETIAKARLGGYYSKYPKASPAYITGASAQWAGTGKNTERTMTYSPKYRIAGPLAQLQGAMQRGELPADLLEIAYTAQSAGAQGSPLHAQYMVEIRAREASPKGSTAIFSLRDVPAILLASKDSKNWVTKDKKAKKAGGASAPRRGNIVPLGVKLLSLLPGKIINVTKLEPSGKGPRVINQSDKMRLKHVPGLQIASSDAAAYSMALDQLVAQGSLTIENAAEFRRQFAGGAGAASGFNSAASSPGLVGGVGSPLRQ